MKLILSVLFCLGILLLAVKPAYAQGDVFSIQVRLVNVTLTTSPSINSISNGTITVSGRAAPKTWLYVYLDTEDCTSTPLLIKGIPPGPGSFTEADSAGRYKVVWLSSFLFDWEMYYAKSQLETVSAVGIVIQNVTASTIKVTQVTNCLSATFSITHIYGNPTPEFNGTAIITMIFAVSAALILLRKRR